MPENLKELFTLYWRVTNKWSKFTAGLLLGWISVDLYWLLTSSEELATLGSMFSKAILLALIVGIDFLLGLINHGVLEENHTVARAIIEQDKP